MTITGILNWLAFWRKPQIDPIAKSLPYPQTQILIELENQRSQVSHYADLLSPKELYDRLSEYSRGSWHEFDADLETLHSRGFLVAWDDKVLISPRGSYLAQECKKTMSYND